MRSVWVMACSDVGGDVIVSRCDALDRGAELW